MPPITGLITLLLKIPIMKDAAIGIIIIATIGAMKIRDAKK